MRSTFTPVQTPPHELLPDQPVRPVAGARRALLLPMAALALAALASGPAHAASLPDVCGNVNGSDDGAVTAADALLVLKRAVAQDIALTCGAPGLPVRTGELTSYGDGSDGARRDGAVRSFTDNGDGTITDWGTGLMWEKKDRAGGLHDTNKTYSWSVSGNQLNGTVATSFLADMNAGEGFAGYNDWRLPNRFELESLLNLSLMGPATFSAFNSGCALSCTVANCSCSSSGYLWTSTSDFEGDGAWSVQFNQGVVVSTLKTAGSLGARAVRSLGELTTTPICHAPDPPQCTLGDPCNGGICSITREACVMQADCPLGNKEQCCCAGGCI